MTSFDNFKKFIEKHNPTVKKVPASWPYDYNDNQAYEVTLDKLTQYFYFNDSGELLVRKVLTNK